MSDIKKYLIWALLLLVVLSVFNACVHLGRYTDKLWLHRCNSIEKMQEFEEDFPNIEVDIVYRGNGVFDITHDADTTFGLKLDSYFSKIGDTDDKMWLDIKNVNEKNVEEMEESLDSIRDVYDVEMDQLIIEGGDYNALETFTDEGYYTSYYVPFDKPWKLSENEKDSCIDKLQDIADSKKTCALSFPGWWYIPIKRNLHRDIDLLTWKHRTTELNFLLSPMHDKMLNDEQLKVILIKSKGHYHR